MKKIFIGVLVLSLMASPAFANNGGKKKLKRKANIECPKNCPDTGNCHKTAKCPNKPGCICD